jgi:intracellular septation protein
MAERKINGWVKAGLEFGPLVVFFIAYIRMRGHTFTLFGVEREGFILATALFIPLMIVSTGLLWGLTGKLSKMQVATLVLVIVFGGLSVWLNDERFFKMKPTMIYLLFAGILGFGLMRGKSYLGAVMGEALALRDEGWMILTRRLALFFAGLAVANEVIWRTMSTDVWVNFKTFGLPLLVFGFFMAQSRLMQTHAIEDKTPD